VGAIRTFVAIDIPSPVRKALAAVQHRFLPLDLKASWVRPDNVHLTLKFTYGLTVCLDLFTNGLSIRTPILCLRIRTAS